MATNLKIRKKTGLLATAALLVFPAFGAGKAAAQQTQQPVPSEIENTCVSVRANDDVKNCIVSLNREFSLLLDMQEQLLQQNPDIDLTDFREKLEQAQAARVCQQRNVLQYIFLRFFPSSNEDGSLSAEVSTIFYEFLNAASLCSLEEAKIIEQEYPALKPYAEGIRALDSKIYKALPSPVIPR